MFRISSIVFISATLLVLHSVCAQLALDGLSLKSDFLRDALLNEVEVDGLPSLSSGNNRLQCKGQLYYLDKHKFRKDVFPMLDSWGKIPSGLLRGHLRELGNYEQCLQTTTNMERFGVAEGKYCTAKVPIFNVPIELKSANDDIDNIAKQWFPGSTDSSEENENAPQRNFAVSVQIGICIPKICDPQIVAEMLSKSAGVPVGVGHCLTGERPDFRTKDVIVIIFFSLVAFLLLLSTAYEVVTNYLEKPQTPILVAFSVISNSRQLFRMSSTKRPGVIDCLNGIRSLSLVWVIFGHVYVFNVLLPIVNPVDATEWLSSAYSLLIQAAPISVDTFFFLSGFLVAWMGLKELERSNGKLNVPLMYLHRVTRLVPVLGIFILFSVTLFRYLGSGPLWNLLNFTLTYTCEKNWWRALLFIQNYSEPNYTCYPPAWYLAVDTQLYILSPLFLFALHRWGKKALPVFAVLCLLSYGCNVATYYNNDFKHFLLTIPPKSKKLYFPTHARYSPWLIGLGFGYVLRTLENRKVKLSLPIQAIGWLASFATMLAVVFGPYPAIQPGYQMHPFVGSFYDYFSKVGWSFALCWIIFACHKGYGGVVNSILSYPFWQVVTRMSYSMFLTHWLVLTLITGKSRTDMYFSDFNAALEFWYILGVTFMMTVCVVLAFEIPMLKLEGILLPRKARTVKKAETETEGDCKKTVGE